MKDSQMWFIFAIFCSIFVIFLIYLYPDTLNQIVYQLAYGIVGLIVPAYVILEEIPKAIQKEKKQDRLPKRNLKKSKKKY